MTYLVVYDIEDDRVRARMAKVLVGYGRRVQESVFECSLEAKGLEELAERLKRTLRDPRLGNVRIYRVCADCLAASLGMGKLVKSAASELCIII